MTEIVIEHVKVEELPEAWRAKLASVPDASLTTRVTVRIEAERAEEQNTTSASEDSLFGMWRDRDDMADVAGYIRGIRAARFTDENTPRKE